MNIASKPSDRHVFFVDDLDAVKKIEEQLITFVCEAATASEKHCSVFKTECMGGAGEKCSKISDGKMAEEVFFFFENLPN